MPVEAGTRVGSFVVHEYVGHGRLGAVYRAFEPAGGSVAVKVLYRLSDPASRERFNDLASCLADVTHPNLLRILDHGVLDGIPYLIEEYVGGETLAERFRRHTMRRPAALRMLGGVAAGLDHAHRNGVLHGNLRLAQILLRADDDQPLVSDLGLAHLRRHQGMTIGGADGTAEYLAPEQIKGEAANAASDRYAFAVIAYQLLVDRAPFEGELEAVLDAHLSARPNTPSQRNRALPVELDAVLLRGLAKDQSTRWSSCARMVNAIAAALGEPEFVRFQASSSPDPSSDRVRLRKTPFWRRRSRGGTGTRAGRL